MGKAAPENTTVDTAVDIDSHDAVSVCEKGHEFELKDIDGMTGTNIFLTVMGQYADPVVKWQAAINQKMNRQMQVAMRSNKFVEPQSLEALNEQNIEGAVIRVTGWRNVKQAFSSEALKRALRRNPHWVNQITQESNDLGNLTAQPSPT